MNKFVGKTLWFDLHKSRRIEWFWTGSITTWCHLINIINYELGMAKRGQMGTSAYKRSTWIVNGVSGPKFAQM